MEPPVQKQTESRSGDRIRKYLDREFARPECGDGVKLPSIKQLAKQLNVSTSTLYYVFRQLRAEGRIVTKPGDGTYLLGTTNTRRNDRLLIGVSYPSPENPRDPVSSFGNGILTSLQYAAMSGDRRMAIIPQPSLHTSADAKSQLLREAEFVDGLVLAVTPSLTLETAREVIAYYEERGKPCLTVNPISLDTTENFFGPNYYEALRRLGQTWIAHGRRRIALLCEPVLTRSVTAVLESVGLQSAIDDANPTAPGVIQIPARNITEQAGAEAMTDWLGSHPAPDAIFAFGGPLAVGALRALWSLGLSVPGQVSVVGGTASEIVFPDGKLLPITSLDQPCQEIGESIVNAMAARIQNRCLSIPGKYLPIQFISGSTTTPAENSDLV